MKKIYSIRVDVANYQRLNPIIDENHDILELLTFDCKRKKSNWPPIEWYISNPKNLQGNFFTLGIGGGAFAFDQDVYDSEIYTIFETAGEILPISIEGIDKPFYIVNVLECLNALNDSASKWQYFPDGTKYRILEYIFHPNRLIECSLFKIPQTSKIEILTHTGIVDPTDEFVYWYEKMGFTGLILNELYSW